jgi:hypothetical protein
MRACAINCLSGEKGGSALTADVLTEVAIWSWVVFVLWATRDGYGNVPSLSVYRGKGELV